MTITIQPGKLSGNLQIIPSKSLAHRHLICAAFAGSPTHLVCPRTGKDIEATVSCLTALGATVRPTEDGFWIDPICQIPSRAVLVCRESASTLRFFLPIVGALGIDAEFIMASGLARRPLSPLWEEMTRMGCSLSYESETTLRCRGKLRGGDYFISGTISSQFISGLIFGLRLLDEPNSLSVTGTVKSRPYIDMTLEVISQYGKPGSPTCGDVYIEGDWSNAAFFLAANVLENDINLSGLNYTSCQGDRAIIGFLPALEENVTIDASDNPDLVPVLAVVAAAKKGAVFTNVSRLRLKESDRVAAVVSMINSLGGKAEAEDDTLTVYGGGLRGGYADAQNDHRIAMAAAIAATVCQTEVTVLGAESVQKSYPGFWDEYRRLGGNYEQHIR